MRMEPTAVESEQARDPAVLTLNGRSYRLVGQTAAELRARRRGTLQGLKKGQRYSLRLGNRTLQMELRALERGTRVGSELPRVVDAGVDRVLGHFLITTWVGDGQNLEEAYFGVREGSWQAPDARKIYANFVPFVQSLFRLHNYAEIIHGDISPGNMVRDATGRFALIDFGFAFPTARTVKRALHEGTPGYAAPEQSKSKWEDPGQADHGQVVDFRSDQFAASAVLYRLLTGNLPYEVSPGEAEPGTRVRPPSRHNHSVWPALDRVVLRGLELDPDRRFPNTRDWLQTLEAARPPESVMPEWLTRAGWHLASWLRRE